MLAAALHQPRMPCLSAAVPSMPTVVLVHTLHEDAHTRMGQHIRMKQVCQPMQDCTQVCIVCIRQALWQEQQSAVALLGPTAAALPKKGRMASYHLVVQQSLFL